MLVIVVILGTADGLVIQLLLACIRWFISGGYVGQFVGHNFKFRCLNLCCFGPQPRNISKTASTIRGDAKLDASLLISAGTLSLALADFV